MKVPMRTRGFSASLLGMVINRWGKIITFTNIEEVRSLKQ